MDSYKIYEDIARRTDKEIYLGVVGPVRCGKSTFITNFVNKMVVPNIKNEYDKSRTLDELPQSAEGKTIMTTQPRFVPKDAVKISIDDKIDLKIRLVDCVGYTVTGAEGLTENNKPRLIKTPWSDRALPFEEAAQIGTKKVIEEHSTIAVVMTTDGSFGDIPRQNYIEAERQTILDLKNTGKPFIVVVNSSDKSSKLALDTAKEIEENYNVSALSVNALKIEEDDISKIFSSILKQFPLTSLRVKMPLWLEALPFEDELIQEIIAEIKTSIENAEKIGDIDEDRTFFASSENFKEVKLSNIDMAEGIVYIKIEPKENLFYKVLSRECKTDITSDFELISFVKNLATAKREYDKLKDALKQVESDGYGVVMPTMEEMTLEEPEIVKQGSRYGVKLKASAPSLHIMKVDVETEICPVVGSVQQSEDIVKYLLKEFESDPKGLWETNMFGKSLHSLVNEGLNKKIVHMPEEAQKKMRKTLSRIVNEGKGGIICILL